MIVSYDSIITMGAHAATPSRADVLEAAERILATEGPDALSMRRLAAALGTSYQVVYTRIGGKADVVRALHDAGFERLSAAADVAAPPSQPEPGTDEHLVALARAYFDFAVAHPRLFDVMFGVPIVAFRRDDRAREVEWEGFRVTWVVACRRWLDARLPERPRGASVRLAWRLWTAVHGITVVHLAGHPSPSGDAKAEIEKIVTLLLAEPQLTSAAL